MVDGATWEAKRRIGKLVIAEVGLMKNSRFIDNPGMVVLPAGSEKQKLLDQIVRLSDMKKYQKALAAFNAGDIDAVREVLSDE